MLSSFVFFFWGGGGVEGNFLQRSCTLYVPTSSKYYTGRYFMLGHDMTEKNNRIDRHSRKKELLVHLNDSLPLERFVLLFKSLVVKLQLHISVDED